MGVVAHDRRETTKKRMMAEKEKRKYLFVHN
jgi:hypothetical protein